MSETQRKKLKKSWIAVTQKWYPVCLKRMQENIPEIGMEQDVKTDSGDTEKCFVSKRFESYDDMMAVIDDLKAHNHPLRVFNSQTVQECNTMQRLSSH